MNSNDKSSNTTQRVTDAGAVGVLVQTLNDNNVTAQGAGLLSAPSITAVLDTHGATQIVDNGGSMDDPTPQLRGSGEPGSVVTVYDNGQVLGQVLVDKTGTWSLQVFFDTPIEPGEHTFSVVSETGEGSEPFHVTVTAADVAQPVLTSVYDNVGETGTVISGGDTDDSTPTFSGLGEPGTYVYLYQDNTVVSRVLVRADGNWTINSDELSPGQHVFTVRAHGGEHSEPFVLNVIGTPDIPSNKPVIESIYDDVGETGSVVSGGSTDDNTPTFSGKGEPGIRIYLFEGNTRLASTVVDADGSWTISGQVWLAPGDHVFTLMDNSGERSEPFALSVSETPEIPDVPETPETSSDKPVIESVYDNVGETGSVVSGGSTDDNTPTFSGKGEPGIRIYLFEGNTRLASTVVDADGSWTISGQVWLAPGDHVFTLMDNSGERSEPFVLNVTEATLGKPVIETAVDNIGVEIGLLGNGAITDDARPTLNGRGEPNTTVSLYVDGRYMVSAVVAQDGSWSLLSPRALTPGEHIFTVRGDEVVSDPFVLTVSNAPQAATLVIEMAIDQTGPVTGVIGDGSATDEHQPVFRGHGEPDAPVFLFVSTGGARVFIGSGVVQPDGTWEVGLDINHSVASGHNVFTVSDGVSDSAPFTLHIGSDAPTVMTAAQADAVVGLEPLTLSLSDLLQDVSSELFANEVTLPVLSDIHPALDLGVVVETDSGVSISVGPLSLVLEPELAHVA